MKNLTLISNVNIINKIFTLVTNKLSINLQILTDSLSLSNVDIIVIDEEYKNENIIEYKMNSKYLILLTKDDIDIDKTQFDFILKKPFLPSQLQVLLENTNQTTQIQIQEDAQLEENDGSIEDLISFVSDMTEERETDEINEYDEYHQDDIVIKKEDLGNGGVLDKDELSKLHDLISDEDNIQESVIQKNMNEDNWIDLSNIIDKAIDDISDFKFDSEKPIKLILNKYSLSELSALFNKLDQNIIDNLIDGKDIYLQLRLDK